MILIIFHLIAFNLQFFSFSQRLANSNTCCFFFVFFLFVSKKRLQQLNTATNNYFPALLAE